MINRVIESYIVNSRLFEMNQVKFVKINYMSVRVIKISSTFLKSSILYIFNKNLINNMRSIIFIGDLNNY